MTFYVASGVENAERVNQAAHALERAGHVRTYDWTTHGSVKDAPASQKAAVAQHESCGVQEAQLVVLLLPGGRGTHAELGLAIASRENKRILVWSESEAPFSGEDAFCVFYHHPAVERVVCPFAELLVMLGSLT